MSANILNAVFVLTSVLLVPCSCQYTVTIYPEFLSQNGRSHFEPDRWNGHNGLDNTIFFAPNHVIGSKASRWLNGDLDNDVFLDATEDPNRKGYPDPNHFNNPSVQRALGWKYLDNIQGYQYDMGTIMTLHAQLWPDWMNTSQHGGIFPNNLDAGAELAMDMLDGLNQYTTGIPPQWFEPVNEPNGLYEDVTWDTIIEFHRILASKIKSKYPYIKVGGPTFNGAINTAADTNYRLWGFAQDFLNMSLYDLDFFSFHPFSTFYAHNNSHFFRGPYEAELVGLIDLVESYAYQQRGVYVPLVPSAYGLGQMDIDSDTSHDLIQWAYSYLNNAYMLTFLNHRDVFERATAFLLSHAEPKFVDASIFTVDGMQTFVATTYRFWKHFYSNQQFLRVESEYNSAERLVSSNAVADPFSQNVTVLLHNYNQSSVTVKLNFYNSWINPTVGLSTCILLNSQNIPKYLENQIVHLNNGMLTIPSEASCFFTFETGYSFARTPVVTQKRHYSSGQAIPITNNTVESTISVADGVFHSAQLRFGKSVAGTGFNYPPTSVTINGQPISEYYFLFSAPRPGADTMWDVFVYDVPINLLKHGINDVKLVFSQTSGYVSTMSLIVGTVSNDAQHGLN